MSSAYRLAAFEAGELDHDETVEFFADLVNTGLAYRLGGQYATMADALIAEGEIIPFEDSL